MSEQEILEGNKLIAEFMGFRVFNKRYPRNHGIGAPEVEWKDCILEKTKYHSSWDWLIPVVERITFMNDFNGCKTEIKTALISCQMENVYINCVNFIKQNK